MKTDLAKFRDKYEKILSDDPGSVAFVFLAQVLYRQKSLDKAMEVLLKGLRHNSDNITGRFLLGKIYYECWMIERAKKELESVFRQAPDNLAAGKILIQIYESEDNIERASEIMETLKSYHGSVREVLEPNSVYEPGLGNEQDGKVIEPQTPDGETVPVREISGIDGARQEHGTIATFTMAEIYIGQNLYDKALEVLERILEADPANEIAANKIEELKLCIINESLGINNENED